MVTHSVRENRVLYEHLRHKLVLHDSDCIISSTVYLTQCCSRVSEDELQGADGWQPKSLATASGRGNQPAEDYRSPTAVARALVTS